MGFNSRKDGLRKKTSKTERENSSYALHLAGVRHLNGLRPLGYKPIPDLVRQELIEKILTSNIVHKTVDDFLDAYENETYYPNLIYEAMVSREIYLYCRRKNDSDEALKARLEEVLSDEAHESNRRNHRQ